MPNKSKYIVTTELLDDRLTAAEQNNASSIKYFLSIQYIVAFQFSG